MVSNEGGPAAPILILPSGGGRTPKLASRPKKPRTRSKRGCSTCKTRKIKCGEERPTCRNCLLRAIPCRYPTHVPATPLEASPPDSRVLSTSTLYTSYTPPSLWPSSGPTPPAMTFTMREMLFFQRFLLQPHALPIGNRSVWLNELPQMAHQQNFLMHAMLALGASDLLRANPGAKIKYEMLHHRGKAIAGLKEAINNPDAWNEQGHADAVLATAYSLAFQSSHLPDAQDEFGVFVQGCALATERIRRTKLQTTLNVKPEWPQRKLEAALEHLRDQKIDVPLIHRALAGIDQVLSLTASPFCHAFGRAMQQTMAAFRESAAKGFLLSSLSYNQWYDLSSGLLTALQDTSDPAPVLLGAYFVGDLAMCKAVIPLHLYPDTPRSELPVRTLRQMSEWVDAIQQTVAESSQHHLTWPHEMMARLEGLLQGLDYTEAASIKLEDKISIVRSLDSRAHMLIGDLISLGSELTAWSEAFIDTIYHRHLGTVPKRQGLPPRFFGSTGKGPTPPASHSSRSPPENAGGM